VQAKGYRYVADAAGLSALSNGNKPVLGLFNPSNMSLEWSGSAASPGKGNAPAPCNENRRRHPDTLIVVTADHSHTSQIVGEDASGAGVPTGYSTNLTTKDRQTLSLTYGTAGYGGPGGGAAPKRGTRPSRVRQG
jgi:alkaline phosphatase